MRHCLRVVCLTIWFVSWGNSQTVPPCRQTGDKNGSQLCIQLKVEKGSVAVASYQFAPNDNYAKRKSLADDFIAVARAEIAKLVKPCALTMSAAQLKSFQKNPSSDPEALRICNGDFTWAEFTSALLAWGDSIQRRSQAIRAIQENGIFRPLVSLQLRSPLIWMDTGEALNSESGVIHLLVADPVDPRTDGTLPILIEGLADGPIKSERLTKLHQALNSFRFSVFCHEKIRAAIQTFYTEIGVPAEVVQLDSAGPIQIRERP